MKTKDKTKESSQHSLCKITRVSLHSRTQNLQNLVQNFPQTFISFQPNSTWTYSGCWSNEMQIYILLCCQLPVGCCLLYNVFVFKYCTIWLNEKYFSSEMSMDLQKSGIDYKPMECISFNLVPEAKCWENKPAFLPLLVSLIKYSKLPHKLFLFFNFLYKKKKITDGAGSCFFRIALGVKSQQTAFI